MFLLEPHPTPYDLRFHIGSIPVRVHPMFWLLIAILGAPTLKTGTEFLLAWVACGFVSILVHELGHVAMGAVFGTHSRVVLYGFGGLAIPDRHLTLWWQRVLVSAAGPLAGFLLLGAVVAGVLLAAPVEGYALLDIVAALFGLGPIIPREWLLAAGPPRLSSLAFATVQFLVFQNLFWGLLNILPIWPLDGGQISRDVLVRLMPDKGYQLSLGISFVTAGLLAINAVMSRFGSGLPFIPGGGIWMAIFFGLLAFESFQLLQQSQYYHPQDPWLGQGRPWER